MRGDEPVTIDVGTLATLRFEVERTIVDDDEDPGDAQLANVAAARLDLARPLVLPEVRRADRIVLGLDQGERPSCLDVGGVAQCRSGAQELGEDAFVLDRVVTLGAGGTFTGAVATTAVAGPSLDALVQQGSALQLRTSSTLSDDPRTAASRMLDGNLETGWIAAAGDDRPTTTLTWTTPQRVSVIGLPTTDSLPASSVESVVVTTDDGTTVEADVTGGIAIIPEVVTTSLSIELTSARDAVDDERNGLAAHLPVGLSEISVLGAPGGTLVTGPAAVDWGCGTGPDVRIDGSTATTSLSATTSELLSGTTVPARPCTEGAALTLPDGSSRLSLTASPVARAGELVLTSTVPWRALTSGQDLVTARHNANPGWEGNVDGDPVPSVVVDGWQQGYLVPEGEAADLTTTFGPGSTYRAALVGGGALALLVVLGTALATARVRRRPAETAPATSDSRWASRVVLGSAGLLTTAVVAGVTGVLALGLVLAVVALAGRHRRLVVLATGVAVLAGGAVTAVVADSTGLTPEAAQWCGVLAVALVVAAALDLRWPSRFAGRSTTR